MYTHKIIPTSTTIVTREPVLIIIVRQTIQPHIFLSRHNFEPAGFSQPAFVGSIMPYMDVSYGEDVIHGHAIILGNYLCASALWCVGHNWIFGSHDLVVHDLDGKWRSNVDGGGGEVNIADTEADATAMVKEDVDWIITNM